MAHDDPALYIANAVREFNAHQGRDDGAQLVASLCGGLAILRNSLFTRLHREVEQAFGVDSMLMPVSELRTKEQVDLETNVYLVAESAVAVAKGRYVAGDETWFPAWLAKLILADQCEAQLPRIRKYLSEPSNERRLKFSDVLARVVPESRRAPLVLFRLFPMSVHVVIQAAFGDHAAAEELRQRQKIYLPAIDDCRACRGRVLAADEQCTECGNPLWNSEKLTATD
jgi:hypothetical protein